jgi:hypothetical protein
MSARRNASSAVSAHDSARRQQQQWDLKVPEIIHNNFKLLCEEIGRLCSCDPWHALLVILPFASANMLKSYVLVGEEQKEINSVLLSPLPTLPPARRPW